MLSTSRQFFSGLFIPVLFAYGTFVSPTIASAAAVQEIIITAQKREESLEKTPISVAAFSAEDLAQRGLLDSERLSSFTPNLAIQRDVIGKVVIRGVGAENFTIAGDPGVAINFDGAYISRSSVAIFDLFDVERVEVLRGPQGTLYGRNATGGVINFISRKPTTEFTAEASADAGNYSKARFEAAISGPITDKLRYRLAGMYYDATDNLTIDFKADIYRDDSTPPPYKYTVDPVVYFGGVPFPNPIGSKFHTVSQGFEFDVSGNNRSISRASRWDQTGFLGIVNWKLPADLTFRSLTSYRDMKFDWLNDGDGLPDFLVTYFQGDKSHLLTQEFQILSDTSGPITWQGGLYYLHEDSNSSIGIPIPAFATSILFDGNARTDAYAVFGQGTWRFLEKWRLNVGLRYSYEKKSTNYLEQRFGTDTRVIDSNHWNAFTPKFGIDYFLSDETLLYASATKGFKSGGFNLLAVQPSYNQETVWSYEVGSKTRLFDGRLQLNGDFFYMDYDNLQVGKVVNLSATIQNAAKARMFGVELEAQANITDNLRVNTGVAWLDTEYRSFDTEDPGYQFGADPNNPADDPAPPSCGTLVDPKTINLSGCQLPRSPHYKGFVEAIYTLPVGSWGSVDVGGSWQFTAKQFFTQFNRPDVAQNAYSLFNARVTWRPANDRWSISGYVENASDKNYFTNSLESGVPTPHVDKVVPQYVVGAPFVWGFKGTYRFGAK
jgi:iron complex outermembrane receptor protein